MTKKQKKTLIRLAVSLVLAVLAAVLPVGGMLRFALFLLPYLVIGYDILISAVRGIIALQPFDENLLMTVATVGALFLGEYTEACAVMIFYQLGELFQSIAVGESRRSIAALMDIRPESANLLDNKGYVREVAPEAVSIGDTVRVRPGERIPLDGIVISGSSALDTSALTGESAPRDVAEGSDVQSGCVNLSGVIDIRVTSAYGESTAVRILDLVENAAQRKSRSERFISKFAKYYTPAVCAFAVLLAFLPPIAGMLAGSGAEWSVWVYRALSFLVISCPCALVISIPMTFFAAIGSAGRCGVLIKGSDYIEKLASVKCAVFDKTGTLTEGTFEVSEIKGITMPPEEVLRYAAIAESSSTHPIALSLTRAYGKPISVQPTQVTELAGCGVSAVIGEKTVAVGNSRFMESLGILCLAEGAGTEVFVAVDGVLGGSIVVSDTLKENAVSLADNLKSCGVERVCILTGDKREEALRVARSVGADDARHSLLPEDKVRALEDIMADTDGCTLFAGDGINDAPVVRRADVGIAMGGLGSDAAIEAADAVIMDDDPLKTVTAIRIAKHTMGIVYQNIVLAIGVKLVCLTLGAAGIAGIWMAIFADVGVMVLAVLNAMRAMKIKEI